VGVFQFEDQDRWRLTSLDGPNLERGEPTTLTWGFLPDGVEIDLADTTLGPSDLVAAFDRYFGQGPGGTDLTLRPWFHLFEESLDSWTAVSGVHHVYLAADDGASFPDSPGLSGIRPDVRIGGVYLDGPLGLLGFNFFPDVGDMVLDTSELLGAFAQNDYRDLRNIIAHEHGHGLGLHHSCPEDRTKLMEPTAGFEFLGPQHDDILGANRGYGDPLEQPAENDTFFTATDLGSFGPGDSAYVAGLSIDGKTDQDVFAFTVPARMRVTVIAAPVGFTYFHGPQVQSGGTAYCTITETLRTNLNNNLGIELLAPSGTDPLLTADYQPLGQAEEITEYLLEEPGTYFVQVFGDPGTDAAQLYDLTVFVSGGAPPVASCRNLTLCSGDIDVIRMNAGSYDPDGDPLVLSAYPPPPYPPGVTEVLFVADDLVYADTCEAVVTVNRPPAAACRDFQTPGDGTGSAVAVAADSLDAGSLDPEGRSMSFTLDPPGPFSPGATRVQFIATDPCGEADTCEARVLVGNDIPVEILALSATRKADAVEVSWEVSPETADQAGFDVYRETAGSSREQLNGVLLEGRSEYAFTDPAPPSIAVDYWLLEVNRSGETRWHGPVSVEALPIAGGPFLGAPYPNPFQEDTRIEYTLPQGGRIRIAVFDSRGRQVRVLLDEERPPGTDDEITWDGRSDAGAPVAAGIYFLRMDAPGATGLRKVVRLR